MTLLSTLYCTDEAIAIKATGDFRLLLPVDQKLASATDGAFASGVPWTLTSASVNFTTSGIKPGHMVQLLTSPAAVPPRPKDDLLAVDTVSAGSLGLRRKGMAAGLGLPPGPAAGQTGISFVIQTFDPQTEKASFDLNQRFDIDPLIGYRDPALLYNNGRELEQLCVLDVLDDVYLDMTRNAEKGNDTFQRKYELMRTEFDELIERASIHWGPLGTDQAPTQHTLRVVRG